MKDKRLNILHLLHKSYPEHVGYSVRSHFMLSHQKKYCNPYALTRPFFIRKNEPDRIDNVCYYRYPRNKLREVVHYIFFKYLKKYINIFNKFYYDYLKLPANYIKDLCKSKKIDLIHGHTPYQFANLGFYASKKLNIPFLYEVRGFWEETNVSLGNYQRSDEIYKKIKLYETDLMHKAKAVITLGKMMKREIISRKVDPKNIFIVPNGVDLNKFKPIDPDITLKNKLGLKNKNIIGYIGSIRRNEGIEILIKAYSLVKKEIKNISLLLIGGLNYKYKEDLKKLILKYRINDDIHFLGKIHPKNIKRYYSIIDIIIIPRIDTKVNRLVTPLKQLEAMAMEKLVISSDLPALKESVKEGISGVTFNSGNFEDLSEKIIYYLKNKLQRKKIGKKARNYVNNHHNWNFIAQKYVKIYKNLFR